MGTRLFPTSLNHAFVICITAVAGVCLLGVRAFLSKTLGLAVENQIFNYRHRFPPLMANGRTNAEDSGPEGAPESFFDAVGAVYFRKSLDSSVATKRPPRLFLIGGWRLTMADWRFRHSA
jgi:hypothetical protein